ncbi:MAG: hypothetical protein IT547_17700 [Hyphomonadaceae bacterium]|nr:hypothetical protein [Hyphomonadaceae bacterium]
MEALIASFFALFTIILLEAGYWIAIALARWAQVVAAGALAGWLSALYGAEPLEALLLGVIVCLIARHLLKPRWRYDYSNEDWP